jgi:hypothetical protein
MFGALIGGTGALVLGLLIGALVIGGFGYFQSGGVNVPYHMEHNQIANGFTAMDLTVTNTFKVRHVMTSEAQLYPHAPYAVFTARETYTQSLWIFTPTAGDQKDIELVMLIWGPGNDGETYDVSFGKFAHNSITVHGWGHSHTWPEGDHQGLSWLIRP